MAYEVSTKAPATVESTSHALNIMGYLHSIRRRKSLMCLGLVIGVGLGSLYYMRIPPVYESNAKILITNKNPDVLGNGESRYSGMDDQVANQISMIRSPLIASEAARGKVVDEKIAPTKGKVARTGKDLIKGKVVEEVNEPVKEKTRTETEQVSESKKPEEIVFTKELPSFLGRSIDSIAASILGGLNAARGDMRSGESPSVVTLSYRTGDPKEAQAVLEAVIIAHKKNMEESYGETGEETVRLITKAKDELTDQLNVAYKAYSKARLESLYSLTSEGERSMVGGERQSLSEKSIFQTRQEALAMRDEEIKMHLAALEAAKKDKKTPEGLLSMAERFTSTSGQVSVEAPISDILLSLMAQEEELSFTYGSDYQPLQRLRAKIALVKSVLPPKRIGRVHGAEEDPIARHVRKLGEELECNKTMCAAYDTLLKAQRDKFKKTVESELAYEKLLGDYTRTKQLYEATVKHLQEINLVKDMVGINALVPHPGMGRKVAPILSTTLSLSSFMGLLIGLGLVYLAEMTDRSFKGPDDVVHRLGAPVIAHMPAIDYNKLVTAADAEVGTVLSPVLCVYHRPKSRDAEAIRGIRTAIFFGNQANTLRLIQFTSAQAGDGKSTLACNVALSIAQSGKRVIIVEADLRRPSFTNVFGKMPEVGFAQVLAGSDRWQDSILTFPEVPNLAVLPCGERPHNPAELLTGPFLAETLDQMKEVYDYVIIDTPPLLPVTDPCSVAARADGVILVVQMGRNTRPNAKRTCSLLQTLEVRLLGIVMNRMTKDGGYGYGYGYGTYGYNYGSGYKYGGYGYRSETGYYARGDAYYEEEHRNGVDDSTPAK